MWMPRELPQLLVSIGSFRCMLRVVVSPDPSSPAWFTSLSTILYFQVSFVYLCFTCIIRVELYVLCTIRSFLGVTLFGVTLFDNVFLQLVVVPRFCPCYD